MPAPQASGPVGYKTHEVKKACLTPSHMPPALVERLEGGGWITVADREMAEEILQLSKCLGIKAKIILDDP
ncbi:MAG: hypothetical protein ACP5IE_06800 [Infirmifilum sp.]